MCQISPPRLSSAFVLASIVPDGGGRANMEDWNSVCAKKGQLSWWEKADPFLAEHFTE
jgi:hypothetical protein